MPTAPLLLGHRGSGAGGPLAENTLQSFDAALKQGCDGIELDVRLKGCGRAVICHDPKVNGIDVARAQPEELSYLPLLKDVLGRYAKRAFIDIEIKVPGAESELLIALAQHFPERGYVVSSFSVGILESLTLRSPNIPLGFICDRQDELQIWPKLPVQYLILHHSLARRELFDDLHDAGKQVFVWTVNNQESMLRFARWGVEGIISDEIALMIRTFRSPLNKDQLAPQPASA